MAKTTSPRPKRKLPRDPETGRFDDASPLNDALLRAYAVRWTRAISDLEPLLAGFAASDDERTALGFGFIVHTLGLLRQSFLDQLSIDQVALRDATKPRLEAPFLKGGDTP